MSTDYRTSRRVAFEREDRGVEQRQLFAIFFAAVVVARVVFLLGVLAGKGRGPAASVSAPPQTEVVAEPTLAQAAPADALPSEVDTVEPPGAEPEAAVASAPIPDPTPLPSPAVVTPPLTSPSHPAPVSAPIKARAPAPGGAAEKARGGGFSVQVLASSDAGKAKALAQRLKSRGYAAYVVSEDGDKLYRVRVGHYEGRDGAEALKARLLKAEGLRGAWIVTPSGAR